MRFEELGREAPHHPHHRHRHHHQHRHNHRRQNISIKRLRLVTILGATWRRLGLLGSALESSWGRLGASWGRLGASWRCLGGVLGVLEASSRRLGGVLGASWGRLGGVLDVLEAAWRRLGGVLREMARKSQLKAQKYHFYFDSVTSTLNPTRKTRGGPARIRGRLERNLNF